MTTPIHNYSTYKKFYKKFFDAYIDFYCELRQMQYRKQDANIIAKIKLQDMVISEMLLAKKRTRIIYNAYADIKNDTKLLEKAQNYFSSAD
jgi:hypothetical protein